MFTAAITVGSIARNPSDEGISSMVDTWIMLMDESNGERKRKISVMKSRGMANSADIREFEISSKGILLNGISKQVKEEHADANIKMKGNGHLTDKKPKN